MILFYLDMHPEVGLIDHMVVLILISRETYIFSSMVAVPVCLHSPNSVKKRSLLSTPSAVFSIARLFQTNRHRKCEAISHCGFGSF